MSPLDPTAVLAVVCACFFFCGAGGYLLGYLEGKAHAQQEKAEADDRSGDNFRW